MTGLGVRTAIHHLYKKSTLNASDFITANKYDFQVLMDNEDKVVQEFNVEGISTKFVIDKNGNIQFKSVGFGGDNKLISELTSMINIVKENN